MPCLKQPAPPHRSTTMSTTDTNNKFFTIKPVESKGLGVISSIPISRGTLILSEAPLFTFPIECSPTTEDLQDVLSTKSTSDYAVFNTLHNAHPHEGLAGTFKSNSLPCGGDDMNLESPLAAEEGVFTIGSRFNSSCIPNVNLFWNFDSEQMEWRVVRGVDAGEELCIAYCDILKTRQERRAALKERWAFDCHCVGCDPQVVKDDRESSEEEKVKMSDMRRTCVGGLLGTVAFGYTVDSTKLALRLLKQEGIYHYTETLSYDAYQLSTGGDQQEPMDTLAWAKKAWKASCILTGVNSPNSRRLLASYEGAKAENVIKTSQQWDEDLDSDVLEELVDSDDDDGYYSD